MNNYKYMLYSFSSILVIIKKFFFVINMKVFVK